jgi:C2H2-type zinc finger
VSDLWKSGAEQEGTGQVSENLMNLRELGVNVSFPCHSHHRNVHVERTFECTICEKSFKRAINLREHLTTHSGEVDLSF